MLVYNRFSLSRSAKFLHFSLTLALLLTLMYSSTHKSIHFTIKICTHLLYMMLIHPGPRNVARKYATRSYEWFKFPLCFQSNLSVLPATLQILQINFVSLHISYIDSTHAYKSTHVFCFDSRNAWLGVMSGSSSPMFSVQIPH